MYTRYLLLLALLGCIPARADTFILPPADIGLIGQLQFVQAHDQETLLDIARNNDVGQNEILLANPEIDRWMPASGAVVTLPKRYVLPDARRSGLVLNLPEMRLYYFRSRGRDKVPHVITHPVSVGRMDWETPLGTTKIVSKQMDPTWRPPQSLKDEAAADGDPLPDVVPPGPDNPLGRYAMRLGIPGYLIHSTNKPYGVGMRVTHGCVRMYPEDIGRLFEEIPVGSPVQIVNQPIKLGWLADTLFIEVHPALEEDQVNTVNDMQAVLNMIAEYAGERPLTLNGRALRLALQQQNGMPVAITK